MRINLEKSIELYESGCTVEKIGQILGFSFGQIARVLRERYPKYKGRNRHTLQERFNERIMPEPMSGCWIWYGNINNGGYGTIGIKKKTVSAHRVSYLLHKGKIKKNLCVCHSCDQPSCVNPDHLFLGTHKENVEDMYKKGRSRSKLDDKTIQQIVEHRESGLLIREISAKLGINFAVVRGVIRGNRKYLKPSMPVKPIKHFMIGKLGALHHCSKKVYQLDVNGNVIQTYHGTAEAGRAIKIDPSAIAKACRGVAKTAGGFKWQYV